MERASFLNNPPLINLRKNFLKTAYEKQTEILQILQSIKDNSLFDFKQVEPISALFQEIHKLKGTGGTYGFDEISCIHNELLRYVRPAFRENHPLAESQIDNCVDILEGFFEYYPFLMQEMGLNTTSHKHYPILFMEDSQRDSFFTTWEYFCIRNKIGFISVINEEEAKRELQKLNPQVVVFEKFDKKDVSFYKQVRTKDTWVLIRKNQGNADLDMFAKQLNIILPVSNRSLLKDVAPLELFLS